ncbi:MAG TPA: hypothetical protein VGJ97_04215 [Anaerolineaceae bacterium]
MSGTQKKVLWALIAIGLVYFGLMAIPNARGAQTEHMLASTSTDEPVTYPNTIRMLSPGSNIKQTIARFIYPGDYHYGYPFYFLSAVAVLPVRLINGEHFREFTALNLWLLRQFISLLPMILAAGVLVYLQTRFRSMVTSVGLFLFLITTRGVFRNGIQWWHPDALTILAVVLTLFFLDRDHLRLGRNFIFAALACGVATSIKLLGVFFAFAILAYLIASLVTHRANLRQVFARGALFTLVMVATVLLTNPFLINPLERQVMVDTQIEKTKELNIGYTHDDPAMYAKSPAAWDWTLRTWYAGWPFLAFLVLGLAAGCLWGPNTFQNRLILLWVAPYSLYLLYFVAVKPDHYFLPAMLPLFSAALALPGAAAVVLKRWWKDCPSRAVWITRAVTAIVLLALLGQVVTNFTRSYSGNLVLYTNSLHVEDKVGG